MDKIYSRKRLKLPKLKGFKYEEKGYKHKKNIKICFAILIAIITAFALISKINPVFNAICTEKAKALATEIINVQSSNAFKELKYEDLVDIVKDQEREYQYAKN